MSQATPEIDGISLPPAGKYELDPAHTEISFVARHMLTKVRGRFTEFDGVIEVAERPEDSSVNVEVKTASVQTNTQQRDDHLRSADFFESEEYPVMTFRSTGVRRIGGSNFELDGDLTIRDVTKPITLQGEFHGWGKDPLENTKIFAEARATVEREDWDLTWNVAVETGGFLVSKTIDIVIDVEAALAG
jgi:polyisoprenoid-binding protein YceI